MAVVERSALESFGSISTIEAAKRGVVLGSPYQLQCLSSVFFKINEEPYSWFDSRLFPVSEDFDKNCCGNNSLSCLFQHCNRQMAFENCMKVVQETLLCDGNEQSACSNYEVSLMLAGFPIDDYVRNSLQKWFVNILEILLTVGKLFCWGSKISSNESFINFGSAGDRIVIAAEEVDGDRDDRQKRKTTDSKHVGDQGKNSRSEGGSTSSSACGAGAGGSSGDDGRDDGEDGGRRESGGGPQSATDEAMEEDEEKEDCEELETAENLDITGVKGYGVLFKTTTESSSEARIRMENEEMERIQVVRRAEARVAAADAAAAAAAATASTATASTAEGSDDEAVAGPSRNVSKTDEEDPEEVGKMSESPETPSEGTPSQSRTPSPDVTDATDATDV